MSGPHDQRRPHAVAKRWIAGSLSAGIVAATAALFAFAPAGASGATTDAQLSLSGVATKGNILGGTTVGIHPGDTVDFKASATPTAGLDNIGLGGLVSGLLGTLASFQVTADLSGLPGGGAHTVLTSASNLAFTFNNAGTYKFTWTAQRVTLLGVVPIELDGNALRGAGIALNASNQYTGQIVVAANPPPPGIAIQLPSLGAAPSLPVVGQLPKLSLPALALPTLPIDIPSVVKSVPGVPGGGNSSTPGGGNTGGTSGSGTGTGTYTPPAPTVPQGVMGGIGGGEGFGGVAPDGGSSTQLGNALPDVPVANPADTSPSTSVVSGKPSSQVKTIDLASNKAPAAQLPVLLAIIAIIALSLVTATYARLFLLRRNVA